MLEFHRDFIASVKEFTFHLINNKKNSLLNCELISPLNVLKKQMLITHKKVRKLSVGS